MVLSPPLLSYYPTVLQSLFDGFTLYFAFLSLLILRLVTLLGLISVIFYASDTPRGTSGFTDFVIGFVSGRTGIEINYMYQAYEVGLVTGNWIVSATFLFLAALLLKFRKRITAMRFLLALDLVICLMFKGLFVIPLAIFSLSFSKGVKDKFRIQQGE